MSIPVRVVLDWERIRLCGRCAEAVIDEVRRNYPRIRSGEAGIDLPRIICDECWRYNTENGGIRIELDPRIIRK